MCEPPISAQSTLSKNALRLLHSGQFSDMEFEIIVSAAPMKNNTSTQEYSASQPQVHTFRAHRVIVASRYFFDATKRHNGVNNLKLDLGVNGLTKLLRLVCKRALIGQYM